ncbi:malonyl-ACP O-methyltransferase BioC [Marinomonas spartinae]|uniref:malonyl-ACP O-methyltransferase BioC n=1 Tax=Marinomonas spartinae TaxID=1792290 RepID=UPI001F162BE5|nr:malonyl-ACP O-methyltransferase BioC [Marinomonas spartinae]
MSLSVYVILNNLLMPTLSSRENLTSYKQQVAQRFDRAAVTYDVYARFQQQVLERLFQVLPMIKVDSVLDLGTGTGRAIPLLRSLFSPDRLVAMDLSQQMLSQARMAAPSQATSFICADAEALPFVDEAFDLVLSSLALQWCLCPDVLFDGLYRAVKPGGYIVFSTLCHGSMPQIDQAWKGLDDNIHVNQYATYTSLLEQVGKGGWTIDDAVLEPITMWFDSPEEAVDSIKKVGAGLVRGQASKGMSPSKWRAFLRQYAQLRQTAGVPLSYQVAFIVAQKAC